MNLMLFSHCILVRGVSRATICDLQRNECWPIPLSLFQLFNIHGVVQLEDQFFNKDEFDLWTRFLIDEDLVFEIDDRSLKMFPTLSMNFQFPALISNCVLQFDESTELSDSLLQELYVLRCRHVQLIWNVHTLRSAVEKFLEKFSKFGIKTVSIILPNWDWTSDESLTELGGSEGVDTLICYASQEDRIVSLGKSGRGVVMRQKVLKLTTMCGRIHPTLFSINIPTFTESQHHNTCLNRKISIDVDGNIKNCPSMSKSYGNIRDTKLIDVVNNPEFQKVWHIKKDEITKCKDCEFRHVCTDCRAYLENPDDQYSAPLKCGYNPYTCEWEEWSTNPLKQKAIEFYGMQDLVKKS